MADPSTPSLDQHLSVHCTTAHTSLDMDQNVSALLAGVLLYNLCTCSNPAAVTYTTVVHSAGSPGATMISCLTVLILRKERSLVGSRSLTVVRDLAVSWWISPAYCTVVALSRVLRIGMPGNKQTSKFG